MTKMGKEIKRKAVKEIIRCLEKYGENLDIYIETKIETKDVMSEYLNNDFDYFDYEAVIRKYVHIRLPKLSKEDFEILGI